MRNWSPWATTRLMRCSKFVLYEWDRTRSRKTVHQGGRQGHRSRTQYPVRRRRSKGIGREWCRDRRRCYEVRRGRLTVPTSGSRSVDIAHGLAVLFRIGTSSSHDAIYCDELILYKEASD